MLIALLGNPGREHQETRHNMAWMLGDRNGDWAYESWQSKFHGRFIKTRIGSQTAVVLKPETYMNRSGRSVQAALQFFKWTADELLVVHDDLELDYGTVAFKKGGGLGGHNGLRSIAEMLGTRDFYRFRLGIGRPQHGSPSSYVLGKIGGDQAIVLDDYLDRANRYLMDGFDSLASGKLNTAKHVCVTQN